MELIFTCTRWGSAEIDWPEFLEKVKNAGYQGVETDLPFGKDKKEILTLLKDFDLKHIGQHWQTREVDLAKHKELYKRHLYNLVESEPLLINSHTGLDFFSFGQNAELLELAGSVEAETGVPIAHETHRGRFSFAAHVTHAFLKAFPSLKLAADLSHWCCVAETLLEEQEEAVEAAIQSSYHIHARVGSSQSAQVIDPQDERYAAELSRFKVWWRAIFDHVQKAGRSYMTITPEYGPFPYTLYDPRSHEALADQWEMNLQMKKLIQREWKTLSST